MFPPRPTCTALHVHAQVLEGLAGLRRYPVSDVRSSYRVLKQKLALGEIPLNHVDVHPSGEFLHLFVDQEGDSAHER